MYVSEMTPITRVYTLGDSTSLWIVQPNSEAEHITGTVSVFLRTQYHTYNIDVTVLTNKLLKISS